MSRRPRLQYPQAVYHVMSRGIRKSSIFVDDHDRRRFLATIADAVHRYRVLVYALCEMTTHYHIVLDTPDGNLSQTMQFVNSVYSQAFNWRHGYTGHVFEARFRSLIVQRESYLRRACRYVVLNPVKGKLTSTAEEWPWSTYRATAGLEAPPPWLHIDWIDAAFDAGTRAEATERYRQFVNNPIARKSRVNLNALVLGNVDFKKRVVDAAKDRASDRDLPMSHLALARPPLASVFVDANDEVCRRDNRIYVAHVTHGYFLSEIAQFLKLDCSTVSRAFQRAWHRQGR